MKVYLGPYSNRFSGQSTRDLYYMLRYVKREYFVEDQEKDFFDCIVEDFIDLYEDFVCPILNRLFLRQRKEKVRIDYYDSWGADHTIALIAHPLLVQLRESKHGTPATEAVDLPEGFDTSDDKHYNGTYSQRAWDYILGEIIWALHEVANEYPGKEEYHFNSDQLKMESVPLENGLSEIKMNYQKDPSKPPYYVDRKGEEEYEKRIDNGLRLLGKYFRNLWD